MSTTYSFLRTSNNGPAYGQQRYAVCGGRFVVAKMKSGKWETRVSYGDDEELIQAFKQSGLWQVPFATRREALAAIEAFLRMHEGEQ